MLLSLHHAPMPRFQCLTRLALDVNVTAVIASHDDASLSYELPSEQEACRQDEQMLKAFSELLACGQHHARGHELAAMANGKNLKRTCNWLQNPTVAEALVLHAATGM